MAGPCVHKHSGQLYYACDPRQVRGQAGAIRPEAAAAEHFAATRAACAYISARSAIDLGFIPHKHHRPCTCGPCRRRARGAAWKRRTGQQRGTPWQSLFIMPRCVVAASWFPSLL